MKKHNSLILLAFAAIVFSSCNNENQTTGSWDGNDYNTGKDTLINNHTYHYSSYGYWYFYNDNQVTRYYPHTGYSETLPADVHRSGLFLSSSTHSANGGASEDAGTFSTGQGGTVEGFGSTAHGVSSGGSEGFGGSAHGGGFGGGE